MKSDHKAVVAYTDRNCGAPEKTRVKRTSTHSADTSRRVPTTGVNTRHQRCKHFDTQTYKWIINLVPLRIGTSIERLEQLSRKHFDVLNVKNGKISVHVQKVFMSLRDCNSETRYVTST